MSTITRRKLYALGEPFGDCCTRIEAGRVICGGGDSSSSTTNKTEVTDARVVGGNDSSNVSANGGSNVTVIATDHSAVSGGLQLGTKAIDAATHNADNTQATAKSMYQDALSFAKDVNTKSQQAYADASGQLASAYANQASDLATAFTDSKAPDKSLLIVGGVVVVGLAAVMVMARKG
jgi:hypothetical protein